MNPLLMTDSYKQAHWKQYPAGTQHVYSYFESRGGEYPSVVFFGLQYLLGKIAGEFVTRADVADAHSVVNAHMGPGVFNNHGWMHIVKQHNGRLPVVIKAVPEGTVVPNRNVLMTIENTDPEVPWLTNWLETLLVQTWYPTTVATQSRAIRGIIEREMRLTAGHVDGVDFKLHDFGFRGSSSLESAAIGGCAHLVNFKGTDTLAALNMARECYMEQDAGFSIPAAEHSTITSWGPTNEYAAFRNMLEQYPQGAVAVVSDSYNIFAACRAWGTEPLRSLVLNRDGVLVVRPDSGDPVTTVLAVLDELGSVFPTRMNTKGYRVLDDHVRVIQGDGVNKVSIAEILRVMRVKGWSAENIAFGMGGALLQKLDRDTQQFAFKCSYVDGTYGKREVWKDPVGMVAKSSKRGRLILRRVPDGGYTTVREDPTVPREDVMREVFRDGGVVYRQSMSEIRARAALSRPPLPTWQDKVIA